VKDDTMLSAAIGGVLLFVAVVQGSLWLALAAGAVWGGWFDRAVTWAERRLRVRVPSRLRRGW
jgi:hypothetical protein